MNTKNEVGQGVDVAGVKRVAVMVGVFVAFAAAMLGALMLWSTSPGPAVVVAVSAIVAFGTFLRACAISACRERLVQEACNWHMAEEHMFLDGQPFSLATAEQS
jgi:hypothetical protein